MGKTSLAVEVGRRLASGPDGPAGGVWLVRLESASTDGQVLDAVIAAMGVPGGEGALLERLRSIECVLVLDNCEHVVGAVSSLAVRCLDAAPGLRVLATSQVPLSVDGEAVFELGPLPLPDAVELFTRRSAAHRPTRSPDGESTEDGAGDPAVLDLCRALDGLPLAIELAAARTRTLSPQDISRRLDDRFAVLSDPTSSRPERLRSLRSTIRWSYDLLFPDDQRGLWALSTFAGGASLPCGRVRARSPGRPARLRRWTWSAGSPAGPWSPSPTSRGPPGRDSAQPRRCATSCWTASARSPSRR